MKIKNSQINTHLQYHRYNDDKHDKVCKLTIWNCHDCGKYL